MLKVYQDKIVSRDGYGTCKAACIASILELTIEEMPDIHPGNPSLAETKWRMWLAERGFKFQFHPEENPPLGYSIAVVTTDRIYPEDHKRAGKNISHACVAFKDEIVHDPFPGGSDILEIHYYKEIVELSDAEKHLHEIRSQEGFCDHGYKLGCSECNESFKGHKHG